MSKYQTLVKRKRYGYGVDKCEIAYKEEKHYKQEESVDTASYTAHRLFNQITVPEKIGHVYCPKCGAATQKWLSSKGMVDICWNCRQIQKE